MNASFLVAAALDPTLETYARLRKVLVVKGVLLPSSSGPVSAGPGSGDPTSLGAEVPGGTKQRQVEP